MRQSAIHRLQGAGAAVVALLGAGYALAAKHDAQFESVYETTVPGVPSISLAPGIKPMPVHVRSVRDGKADIVMTMSSNTMMRLVILPDAIRRTPVNYNPGTDPFRAAVARYGVARQGATVDCRTGKATWRTLEAATDFTGPASWSSSIDPTARSFIPVVSPTALAIVCQTPAS